MESKAVDGVDVFGELFVICFIAAYDFLEGFFVYIFRSFSDGRDTAGSERFGQALGEFAEVGEDAEAAERLAEYGPVKQESEHPFPQ